MTHCPLDNDLQDEGTSAALEFDEICDFLQVFFTFFCACYECTQPLDGSGSLSLKNNLGERRTNSTRHLLTISGEPFPSMRKQRHNAQHDIKELGCIPSSHFSELILTNQTDLTRHFQERSVASCFCHSKKGS